MSIIDRKSASLDSELYGNDLVGNDDQEMRILGSMLLAARRNFWIVAVLAMLAAACAFIAASLVQDRYTAASRVKLNTRVNQEAQFTPGGPDLPINLASMESELEVLRSSDLIEAAIFELDLITRPPETADEATQLQFEDEFEELLTDIRDNRTIEQIGTVSAVFEINVTNTDPYLASRLANSLGRQYLDRQRLEKMRTLERAQGWLSERTLQIQSQITDLLQQQETYVIESPFSPEEAATITAQRQIGLRQLTTLQDELDELESRIARITELGADGEFQNAAALLPVQSAQLRTTLEEVSVTPTNAQADVLSAEISAALDDLADQRLALTDAIASSEASLAELRAKQQLQAIHDGELRQIENEIAVAQAIYQDFVSELSRRTEQTDFLDSDGRIIEFARPPRTSSQPNEPVIGVAAFIAVMFLGLFAVMLAELGHRRLRTTREFEETSGMDLRGVMPHLGRQKDIFANVLNGWASLKYPGLHTAARKLRFSILAAEAHNHGATKDTFKPDPDTGVLQLQDHQQRTARILAGASSVSGEGQSTSLLAIAQAFAEAGEKVVLVDGDFWNSPYKDKYESQTAGWSANWDAKSRLCDSGIDGLQILPARIETASSEAGRDVSGFFSSKECDAILAELANRFDRIVIDAPPLLEVIESVSLLDRADQVIFFSRWNATEKASVMNAVRILDDVSIRPAFCVATCVKLRKVARYGDKTLAHLNRATAPKTT